MNVGRVEVLSESPRIYRYKNFLSGEECDEIISLGESKLQASSVAGASGTPEQSKVRTSHGTFLEQHELLRKIEDRIAIWTQIPPEHGESFYLLRYENGQEYLPHFDFFDPALPGMSNFLGPQGQRTATVLLYLQTPEQGGETTFPGAGIHVPAIRGDAVLFWSQTPDHQLDRTSLHGGKVVHSGTKYCATKWIRENRNRPRG